MRQEPPEEPLDLARVAQQIIEVENAEQDVENEEQVVDEFSGDSEGDEIDRLMLTAQEHDLEDET